MEKKNIFVFLIIICILFGITAVSAVDNQADTLNEDKCLQISNDNNDFNDNNQLNLKSADYNDNNQLNLESADSNHDTISESQNEDSNQNTPNIQTASEGETANFTQLHEDIMTSGEVANLEHDYVFEDDEEESRIYEIRTLVINGNNHIINGANSDYTLKFFNKEIEGDPSSKSCSLIINDLTFTNFNESPLAFEEGDFTLNNVNFTNCSNASFSLIGLLSGLNLTINNCNFYSNSIQSYLSGGESRIMIYNSKFSGNNCSDSAIDLNRGQLFIENSTFENFTSKHGSIINYKGDTFLIKNSKFLNSHANSTGGAIIAKYFPLYETAEDESYILYTSDDMIIENCTFSNLSSTSNGGAIHIDLDSGSYRVPQSLNISGSNFTDCSSKFGGAVSILGGSLNIRDCLFENNSASFEGGAIYSSWTNLSITNTKLNNNIGEKNAGALYFDKGKLTIEDSNFTNNKALAESNKTANAIYAYDVNASFSNSTFDNGGVGVYADFAEDSIMENVNKTNDIFLLDNHNYILSVETPGIKLNLTNSDIIVDTLPVRFDARDWGWTTPGKVQGDNDDCWAFATIASIETALGKSTGTLYNLSQNYVQKLQLKYFYAGDLRISLTGFAYSGLGYALSWYGVLPTDMEYDDRGMIADTDLNDERIHIQDAMFIYTGQEDTVEQIKRAIMKYGAVTVQYYVSEPEGEVPTEGDDIAIMDHGTHFISLIGWDENGNTENESQTDDDDPYKNFIWITKDSLSGYGETSYNIFEEIDYFAIVPQRVGIAYIFENAIDYHVNYQTDLTGLTGFDSNYTYYSNEFTSKYDELIGAVGTYFNESGIEYSFDIFVNNEKVHSQSGASEFAGFRTIKLDNYIPIRTGDIFKVVFKSNSVPYQAWSRVHYMEGISLASADGEEWTDLAALKKTVSLKVYTLELDDESSFTALAREINQSEDELNLTHDYRFNESIDPYLLLDFINVTQISVEKNKFVINGNNHIIDGAGIGCKINFFYDGGELIINDLTFKDFNTTVLSCEGNLILNNVNFTSCKEKEGIVYIAHGNMTISNCNFHSNPAGQVIGGYLSNVSISDSSFLGNGKYGNALTINRGQLKISNSIFENFTSLKGAIIDYKGDCFELTNSSFKNSYSNTSGGGILAKYFPMNIGDEFEPIYISSDPFVIRDCTFENLRCTSDGGAIHIDLDSGAFSIPKIMNIINSNFTSSSSKFGGAISILGGTVNIEGCNFQDNSASFEGGAIYSSWTNLSISKSNIRNNTGLKNAGGIYFDKGKLTIEESNFTGNKVLDASSISANAIYAHDVDADFSDSLFDNGGVAVYADFASNSKLTNIEKNNDIFLLDNHNYILSVETPGIKLNLKNNEIIYERLPSRFDARDWGWTSPAKYQGDNDDCWAFATIASIETALGKSTGIIYNLSQNYVQKLELKYYEVGDKRISLTGFIYSGLGYALSWYGVLPTDGNYDDRGMIAASDMAVERIHVQDAMFIYTGLDDTIEELKKAILKYGAVTVQYYVYSDDEPVPSEGDDIAIMDHGTHFISLIGWDDNYLDDDGNPKGVWITKDSLYGFSNTEYQNFPQVDYYAIVPQRAGIAYIFENAIDYHVNYQTDLTGLAGFDNNYTFYSNEFASKYDELIGAVGTYFNESGISYSFDIFVNNQKVHSQSGVSEFAGFRTIILDKYIPIKTGDIFKVVFKSNSVPYQAWSRVHYLNGSSLVSTDGSNWIDFAPLNKTVCLKVYTVADDTKIVDNSNMIVDYDGGSYFSVKVITADGRAVGAGEEVKFTINGKTTTVKTDYNGYAKILIGELPGTYTITTVYRGQTYQNTVTVKQVLTTSQVSIKNTDNKLVLKATLKINGKPVQGKVIKFTFRGKTYSAKTNKNGVAQVTIKKSVFKNLSGKSYAVKIAYGNDVIKSTVKIKQFLKAYKASVKKNAKKFYLKASLKLNGKAAKGKVIKFKFKGKTYKAKTNKKGLAKVTIKRNVIKKLKKGKSYAVTVSYGKDSLKTTVKVK